MRGRGGGAGSLLGWGREGFPDRESAPPREPRLAHIYAFSETCRAVLRFHRSAGLGSRLGSGPAASCSALGKSCRAISQPLGVSRARFPSGTGGILQDGGQTERRKCRECSRGHSGRCCSVTVEKLPKRERRSNKTGSVLSFDKRARLCH